MHRLDTMSGPLQEMRFAADCLALEPKNYHAWAHRQAVLVAAGTVTASVPAAAAAAGAAAAGSAAGGAGTAALAAELHSGSGANHWAAELEYVDACIEQDLRDNSAWAQRSFLLRNRYCRNNSRFFVQKANAEQPALHGAGWTLCPACFAVMYAIETATADLTLLF